MIHFSQTILNTPLLKYHLKVMRYCGFAVFDDQRYYFVHKSRGVFAMLLWIVFLTTQFIDLYQVFGDVPKMTTNAAPTLLIGTVLWMCVNFLFFKSELTTILFNEIDTNFNKILSFAGDYSERHRRNIMDILDKNLRKLRTLTLIYWLSSFIPGNMMVFMSFWRYLQTKNLTPEEQNDGEHLLIVRSWYPVDVYENFIPIFIHQAINCYLGLICTPLMHTLIVALMIYAITMLEILKYRCETITDDLVDGSIDDREVILHQKLRAIVITQLAIGRYVHNLDKLISSSMFVVFVIFSILLCSLLFQLSTMELDTTALIQLCFISSMIVALLMFYWHANEIAYQSNALPDSIYLCDWCNCSIKFKRLMLIFMIGSQKPLTLSALYFTMNLEAFINILKASYSYYTLLLHISDRA